MNLKKIKCLTVFLLFFAVGLFAQDFYQVPDQNVPKFRDTKSTSSLLIEPDWKILFTSETEEITNLWTNDAILFSDDDQFPVNTKEAFIDPSSLVDRTILVTTVGEGTMTPEMMDLLNEFVIPIAPHFYTATDIFDALVATEQSFYIAPDASFQKILIIGYDPQAAFYGIMDFMKSCNAPGSTTVQWNPQEIFSYPDILKRVNYGTIAATGNLFTGIDPDGDGDTDEDDFMFIFNTGTNAEVLDLMVWNNCTHFMMDGTWPAWMSDNPGSGYDNFMPIFIDYLKDRFIDFPFTINGFGATANDLSFNEDQLEGLGNFEIELEVVSEGGEYFLDPVEEPELNVLNFGELDVDPFAPGDPCYGSSCNTTSKRIECGCLFPDNRGGNITYNSTAQNINMTWFKSSTGATPYLSFYFPFDDFDSETYYVLEFDYLPSVDNSLLVKFLKPQGNTFWSQTVGTKDTNSKYYMVFRTQNEDYIRENIASSYTIPDDLHHGRIQIHMARHGTISLDNFKLYKLGPTLWNILNEEEIEIKRPLGEKLTKLEYSLVDHTPLSFSTYDEFNNYLLYDADGTFNGWDGRIKYTPGGDSPTTGTFRLNYTSLINYGGIGQSQELGYVKSYMDYTDPQYYLDVWEPRFDYVRDIGYIPSSSDAPEYYLHAGLDESRTYFRGIPESDIENSGEYLNYFIEELEGYANAWDADDNAMKPLLMGDVFSIHHNADPGYLATYGGYYQSVTDIIYQPEFPQNSVFITWNYEDCIPTKNIMLQEFLYAREDYDLWGINALDGYILDEERYKDYIWLAAGMPERVGAGASYYIKTDKTKIKDYLEDVFKQAWDAEKGVRAYYTMDAHEIPNATDNIWEVKYVDHSVYSTWLSEAQGYTCSSYRDKYSSIELKHKGRWFSKKFDLVPHWEETLDYGFSFSFDKSKVTPKNFSTTIHFYDEDDNLIDVIFNIVHVTGEEHQTVNFEGLPTSGAVKAKISVKSLFAEGFHLDEVFVFQNKDILSTTYREYEEETAMAPFDIYPNPTANEFWITYKNKTFEKEDLKFQVIDQQGRILIEKEVEWIGEEFHFDLSNYPAGIYYVQLFNSIRRYTKQVVKQRL